MKYDVCGEEWYPILGLDRQKEETDDDCIELTDSEVDELKKIDHDFRLWQLRIYIRTYLTNYPPDTIGRSLLISTEPFDYHDLLKKAVELENIDIPIGIIIDDARVDTTVKDIEIKCTTRIPYCPPNTRIYDTHISYLHRAKEGSVIKICLSFDAEVYATIKDKIVDGIILSYKQYRFRDIRVEHTSINDAGTRVFVHLTTTMCYDNGTAG